MGLISKKFFFKNNNYSNINNNFIIYFFSLILFSSFSFNNNNNSNFYCQCGFLARQDIAVSYALDDGYKYPTYISIVSLLENASPTTCYTVYLLFEPKSFQDSTGKMFMKLEEKYIKSKIVIILMDESKFKNARIDRYPMPTYYRLALAPLIPDIDRVIYLDGDTIILKDLSSMINLQMDNNVLMGFVDNSFKKAEAFGIKTYKYVTAGVLLMNLRKIRTENLTEKFFSFIDENTGRLTQEDQTVINIVLHGRIDLLPPQYGCWNFVDKKALFSHNNYGNEKLGIKAYNEKELEKAWSDPTIAHYVRGKPWAKVDRHANVALRQKWWDYAKISDEYSNILKYSASRKLMEDDEDKYYEDLDEDIIENS